MDAVAKLQIDVYLDGDTVREIDGDGAALPAALADYFPADAAPESTYLTLALSGRRKEDGWTGGGSVSVCGRPGTAYLDDDLADALFAHYADRLDAAATMPVRGYDYDCPD